MCSPRVTGWYKYSASDSCLPWYELALFFIIQLLLILSALTHWGRVTHICVGNLTIIGSDNGLSPVRRQAIIWTNDELLLIEPLALRNKILWKFNRNYNIFIQENAFEVSSAKWQPFCLGLNVLILHDHVMMEMRILYRPFVMRIHLSSVGSPH